MNNQISWNDTSFLQMIRPFNAVEGCTAWELLKILGFKKLVSDKKLSAIYRRQNLE